MEGRARNREGAWSLKTQRGASVGMAGKVVESDLQDKAQ